MQFDVIVPTVKDRIVQTAVRLVIEPIFEVTFCEGSYGFRRRGEARHPHDWWMLTFSRTSIRFRTIA